jgi:hypothetical protein
MVVVFSYRFLSSFLVGVQYQEWPMEQHMWQKDTKRGSGGTQEIGRNQKS